MPNEITIRFASQADKETALKQINRAREYAAKDTQLGAIGTSQLVRTIERANSIETQDQKAELIATMKAIRRDCDAAYNGDSNMDYASMMQAIREAITDALDTTKTTTKKKV